MEEKIVISKLELEAIKLACRMYALARYDGEPYHIHSQEVVEILKEFGETRPELLAGGWLHDLMELSDMSYNDINRMFGLAVAEIVYLCTDLKGRNRRTRKAEPLYFELRENLDAVKVKLADRIANLRRAVLTCHSMGIKYKIEDKEFRGHLYVEGHIDAMWAEIDRLIEKL